MHAILHLPKRIPLFLLFLMFGMGPTKPAKFAYFQFRLFLGVLAGAIISGTAVSAFKKNPFSHKIYFNTAFESEASRVRNGLLSKGHD